MNVFDDRAVGSQRTVECNGFLAKKMAEEADEYVAYVGSVDIAPCDSRDKCKELCDFRCFEVHLCRMHDFLELRPRHLSKTGGHSMQW